jgi:hypothetical protein
MAKRAERSSAGFLALVLIVLLAGIGWNHRRNVAAEGREIRPYRSYSDAEIAALVAAYEPVAEAAGDRYESAIGRRSEARSTGHLMGNVREFERVQGAGREAREARSEFASARSQLELLHAEQARRAGEGSELQLFLRRAFSF